MENKYKSNEQYFHNKSMNQMKFYWRVTVCRIFIYLFLKCKIIGSKSNVFIDIEWSGAHLQSFMHIITNVDIIGNGVIV